MLEICGRGVMMKFGKIAAYGGIPMSFRIILLLVLGTAFAAGCAVPPEAGEPPKRATYIEWAAAMAQIPEIIRAEELCAAGVGHHRSANIRGHRLDIYEEYSMAILLFEQAADQLFRAWDRYPEYEEFILMQLDMVYGYIHACVTSRPHYFEPTDPLNIYGGALTYQQRQRMEQYRQKLSKWEASRK